MSCFVIQSFTDGYFQNLRHFRIDVQFVDCPLQKLNFKKLFTPLFASEIKDMLEDF